MTRRYSGLRLTPEQKQALDDIRPHIEQLQAEFGDTWEIGPCHPWNGRVVRIYARRRAPMTGALAALSAKTPDDLRYLLRDRS